MTPNETNDETLTTSSIELEVEVPGTPEQVWRAIATAPGVEAWFLPSRIEEREGGTVGFDMGFGLEDTGRVSAWDPPRRLALAEDWDGNAVATEFLVEARSGGTCVVRLVSSITGKGNFDDEIEGMREGWLVAFKTLRIYLEHFPDEPVSTVYVARELHRPPERALDAWAELADELGAGPAAVGERFATTAPGAPVLAGTVEWVGEAPGGVMVRAEAPVPGVAVLAVVVDGEHVNAVAHLFLYGDDAPAVAVRETEAWEAWLEARYPAPQPADAS
jgi:uncharacterized protein YndB with AHSA1/START domain